MHIDASAIVAVLANEPERASFFDRMRTGKKSTSPISVFEASIALGKLTGSCVSALGEIMRFLELADIEVLPIEADVLPELCVARDRYGKGSGHPARLNLGDCVSYAMAKRAGVQLLYKGSDFAQTDMA
ncbi:MAG: type II toxin-antitoxin system VapC family toxin [Mesorhizobium sp.]